MAGNKKYTRKVFRLKRIKKDFFLFNDEDFSFAVARPYPFETDAYFLYHYSHVFKLVNSKIIEPKSFNGNLLWDMGFCVVILF